VVGFDMVSFQVAVVRIHPVVEVEEDHWAIMEAQERENDCWVGRILEGDASKDLVVEAVMVVEENGGRRVEIGDQNVGIVFVEDSFGGACFAC